MFRPALIDLSNCSDEEAAIFITDYCAKIIPNSSTKFSLNPEGYSVDGFIEATIRSYRAQYPNPKDAAIKAIETGCGNCEEMAYASALLLRKAGFAGNLTIGQCGINHKFLFVGEFIADPWAQVVCHSSKWRGIINGYGGSIKKGIMRGRIVSSNSEELEDEKLDYIENIPINYHQNLKSTSKGKITTNSTFSIFLSDQKKEDYSNHTFLPGILDKAPIHPSKNSHPVQKIVL